MTTDRFNHVIETLIPEEKSILLTYFSVTTLSTVGFGDYYPVSNLERLCGFILLFGGVISFSLIQGQLFDMIYKVQIANQDYDDSDNLQKFMLQIKRFNQGVNLSFESEIYEFFEFKWKHDKNQFVVTREDQQVYEQLPREVVLKIYRDFVFKDFLLHFRRYFNFRKQRNLFHELTHDAHLNLDEGDNGHSPSGLSRTQTTPQKLPWHRYKIYPFHDWDNIQY